MTYFCLKYVNLFKKRITTKNPRVFPSPISPAGKNVSLFCLHSLVYVLFCRIHLERIVVYK